MGNASIYERIGGEAALLDAVERFYEKVLGDERTAPFFQGLDMNKQIQKQTAFMARALGGPEEFRGRDMRTAHAELVRSKGLTDEHFDAVAGHLQATLQEMGVDEALIGEVITTVAGTRDEVLGR